MPEPAAAASNSGEPAVSRPDAATSESGEPSATVAAAEENPAAVEPHSEPAVKPIIVGGPDEPPVERKRGWWRR